MNSRRVPTGIFLTSIIVAFWLVQFFGIWSLLISQGSGRNAGQRSYEEEIEYGRQPESGIGKLETAVRLLATPTVLLFSTGRGHVLDAPAPFLDRGHAWQLQALAYATTTTLLLVGIVWFPLALIRRRRVLASHATLTGSVTILRAARCSLALVGAVVLFRFFHVLGQWPSPRVVLTQGFLVAVLFISTLTAVHAIEEALMPGENLAHRGRRAFRAAVFFLGLLTLVYGAVSFPDYSMMDNPGQPLPFFAGRPLGDRVSRLLNRPSRTIRDHYFSGSQRSAKVHDFFRWLGRGDSTRAVRNFLLLRSLIDTIFWFTLAALILWTFQRLRRGRRRGAAAQATS